MTKKKNQVNQINVKELVKIYELVKTQEFIALSQKLKTLKKDTSKETITNDLQVQLFNDIDYTINTQAINLYDLHVITSAINNALTKAYLKDVKLLDETSENYLEWVLYYKRYNSKVKAHFNAYERKVSSLINSLNVYATSGDYLGLSKALESFGIIIDIENVKRLALSTMLNFTNKGASLSNFYQVIILMISLKIDVSRIGKNNTKYIENEIKHNIPVLSSRYTNGLYKDGFKDILEYKSIFNIISADSESTIQKQFTKHKNKVVFEPLSIEPLKDTGAETKDKKTK